MLIFLGLQIKKSFKLRVAKLFVSLPAPGTVIGHGTAHSSGVDLNLMPVICRLSEAKVNVFSNLNGILSHAFYTSPRN